MVNISASHAGARGSIPRFGNKQSEKNDFLGFSLHRLNMACGGVFFCPIF
jgi:hypothetical protein